MQAPNFRLMDKNNQIWSLENYNSEVVLITFWVTWCPDCLKDLPQKNRLYEAMDASKLDIVMIHVTGRDVGVEHAIDFLAEQKFSFPVLFDERTKVYDQYGCTGVPTTFILNKNREIVGRYDERSTFIEIFTKLSELI